MVKSILVLLSGGIVSLSDIDECADNTTYMCSGLTAVCTNSIPGWTCDCGRGYTQNNLSDNVRVCTGKYNTRVSALVYSMNVFVLVIITRSYS